MLEYEYVTQASRLPAIAQEISEAQLVGLDIETTSLMPHEGEIRLVQLNTGKGIYVVDLFQTQTLEPIVAALAEQRAIKVGQNCLTGRTRVTKADGSVRRLEDMVRDRDPGPVLTLNEQTGQIEAKPVVGWLKGATRAWDDWRSIELEGRGRINLTIDHEVLTTTGRKRADQILPGDQIWTNKRDLSPAQQALLLGTLMGDASLVSDQKSCLMRSPYVCFSHCLAQRDYAAWKGYILGDLVKSVTEDKKKKYVGFAALTGTQQVHTRTSCDSRLGQFRTLIKQGRHTPKRLTDELIKKLTPAAIAVWLCDDGSRNRSTETDGPGYTISACVSAFGESYVLLKTWLEKQGWPVRLCERADGHKYLKIGREQGTDLEESGVLDFWTAVAPYFHSSMAYKVPPLFRSVIGTGWLKLQTSASNWSEPVKANRPLARQEGNTSRYGGFKRTGKGPRQYCLMVQDNANFLAEGFFVSNCKFEQKWFLHKYGIELWPLFDTYRASAIIYNGKYQGKGVHDLYALYARELNLVPQVPDQGVSDWTQPVLTKQQLDYAAEDVTYLFQLRDALKPKLKELGLNRTALIEFGAILPEAEMELNGLYLDAERWMENVRLNAEREERLHRELLRELPHPSKQLSLLGFDPDFNLDSSSQLLASLQMLGVQVDSTNEMTIAMHASEFPVINKILEYKEYAHARKNFGADYLTNIFKPTGRIHTNYYPFTGAGRYASSKVNLQQIPRKAEYRRCFRAPARKRLLVRDYSQVELRLLAEISNDEALMGVYIRDEDAHTQTASIVSGVPISDVSKAQRQSAKAVNFGFCLAEGQLVLTNEGLIPIEDIKDWHQVWDGVEWVSHEGLLYKGEQDVIEFDGLVATPDHEVYTDAGTRLPLRIAASTSRFGRIATGAIGTTPARYTEFDRAGQIWREKPALRRNDVQPLLSNEVVLGGEPQEQEDLYLSSQAEVRRFESPYAWGTVRRYDAAVLSGHASVLASVQGSRHSSTVQLEGALRSMGTRDVSHGVVRGEGLRSDRQQRALFSGEPETYDVLGEPKKQGVRRARVYDLLNAGPRHRFTVSGKIVSNCYGMQAKKFVLYAKSNYGVDLSLRDAYKMRDKYFEGYRGVAAWHNQIFSDSYKRLGMTRTLNGRLRYLPSTSHNEFANSPVQGSGADALKAALRLVYKGLKESLDGVAKMIHMVHDEIILEVDDDPEAIREADRILEKGMNDGLQPMLARVPAKSEGHSAADWSEK